MKYLKKTSEQNAIFEFDSEEEMKQMKSFIWSICGEDCVIDKLITRRKFKNKTIYKKEGDKYVVKKVKKLSKITVEVVEKKKEKEKVKEVVEEVNNADYWKINEAKDDEKCNDELNEFRLMYPREYVKKNKKNIGLHNFNRIKAIKDVRDAVEKVYNAQEKAFKCSISFGFILEFQKDESISYKCFNASVIKYHKEAVYINKKQDLEKLEIDEESIMKYCKEFFPDSKAKLIAIMSCYIKTFNLEQNIGACIELPEYILKNRCLYSLKDAKNNMCFWDCVGIHISKKRNGFMKASKSAFIEFYEEYDKNYKGFDFVNELDRFEDVFSIGVNIYEYNGEDVKFVRRCLKEDVEIMNINLYLNHFSYICNIDKLCKKYVCENCGHSFQDNTDLKRHDALCKREKEDVFAKYPTIYEPKRNLIVELNEWFGCSCSFKYPYMIVYDFESLLIPFDKGLSEKLKVTKSHRVVSVSIYSNIEGYTEAIHIENNSVESLFSEMFKHFDEMSKKAGELMKVQMCELYEKISDEKLIDKLDRYCKQCPVLGFNSGRYDINVNIEEFMSEVLARGKISAVKAGNCYKSISMNSMQFLDITQYLPPTYNLDAYIRAFYDGVELKGVFPYEFMDSYDKLDMSIGDLERKHFHSSLRNSDISNEQWDDLQKTIKDNDMKTIRDLLKWYNNLDVVPFLGAIKKQKEFFYDLDLDMFKDAMSLPALSEKILFQNELIEFNNAYIHERNERNESAFIYSDIAKKLEGYKVQDLKVKERYDEKAFIGVDEVEELIKNDNNKCHYCWSDLKKYWSLDRLDNKHGHNKGNCVLCCVSCNKQRKDDFYMKFYRKKALLRYSKEHPLIYLIDEENKEVFYKLKSNMVGGPSVVFHRYAEKDKTEIRKPFYKGGKWSVPETGKKVDRITGFDANALYLWAVGQDMPCGKLCYTDCDDVKLVRDTVLKGSLFGFVECDIEVNEADYGKFGEFPPIFKTAEYNQEEAGEYMDELIKKQNGKTNTVRKLISSFKAEKMLIKTDRLKWMLEHGLELKKVYGFIRAERGKIFKSFENKVSDERRKGDVDKRYAIIAEMWKLVGNSAFGRTGMNKSKHCNTIYADEGRYKKEVSGYLFKDAVNYGDIYEVKKDKRKTKQNIPIQVACSIYDDAKLRMTEFYYDCVAKYLNKDDFQYIEMDTDSAYMSLSGNFEDLIKAELRKEFEADKHNWFPRDDTIEHKRFDRRKAGLFKIEFEGSGIVAVCSKMYYVKGFDEKDKLSAKGIQARNNKSILNFESYKDCVLNSQRYSVKNCGIRMFNDRQISKEGDKVNPSLYNYEVTKSGLNPVYDKRIVLNDGVTTVPLNI